MAANPQSTQPTKTPQLEVTVPLLLAREDVGGLVQPLRIQCPENPGEGHWDPSISKTFNDLEHDLEAPSNARFADLLPLLKTSHDTTIEFLTANAPTQTITDLTDPSSIEGSSHVLLVMLGLYALGADQRLGGTDFRNRLRTWTATSSMRTNGQLIPVGLLQEKLLALLSQPQATTSTVPSIQCLLLAEGNRADINRILRNLPHQSTGEQPVSIHEEAGRIDVFLSSENRPRLQISFCHSFQDATATVFGKAHIERLQRSLAQERITKWMLRKALPIGIAAVVLITFAFWSTYYQSAIELTHLDPQNPVPKKDTYGRTLPTHTIFALNEDKETVWTKSYDGKVLLYGPLTNGNENPWFWVSQFNDGPNSGWLFVYDAYGREQLRFHPGKTTPYFPDKIDTNLQIAPVFMFDILSHPGKEIIASAHCDWFPNKLCILSEQGELLKTFWHPGTVSHTMVQVPGTRLLIFHGPNNRLRFSKAFEEQMPPEEGAPPYYYTVYAYDMEKLPIESEGPPHILDGIPDAKPNFLYVVAPRGEGTNQINVVSDPSSPSESLIEIEVGHDGPIYVIKPNGEIVSSRQRRTTDIPGTRGLIPVYPRDDHPMTERLVR